MRASFAARYVQLTSSSVCFSAYMSIHLCTPIRF